MRRPLFWFSLVMWIVSSVIAILLVQLGGLIMSDLPTAGRQISKNDFINQEQLTTIETEIHTTQQDAQLITTSIQDTRFRLETLSLEYQNQRANFDNWIKTRTATEESEQNPEVVQRLAVLENIKSEERKTQVALRELEQKNIDLNRKRHDLNKRLSRVHTAADEPYHKALKRGVLMVFLLRLAITLPLLLISAYLIFKHRQSRYWPVYRGFVLFSLFAFFVELVPYLPSYGGYVRYSVGIILALIFAYYVIKGMERYITKKKNEQSKSEPEKRKQIKYEAAVKSISDGICPSCDRKFKSNASKNKTDTDAPNIDFCIHCGFCLFKKCTSCGTRDNSFYPFCGTCGTATETQT